ncbi:MAG: transposase [Victivallales bacterium]
MAETGIQIIAKHLPQAIMVLTALISGNFGRLFYKNWSEEAKRLRQAKQPPLLSKTRWCFLKRRENLTEKKGFKLNELLKMNLRTVKAYLLREQFQKLWEYRSPGWAGKFLEQWCHAAIFSRSTD